MWKEISNNSEVICYEKQKETLSVRLEARDLENEWIIYRSFRNDHDLNYTEEYSVKSKDEAEKMISQLKKEKDPSQKEIVELMKSRNKKVRLNIRRDYKEDSIEKWYFTINDDKDVNFFSLRVYDKIELDLILHEKYKIKTDEILNEIGKIMSFENIDADKHQNIYFYSGVDHRTSFDKMDNGGRYEVEFGLGQK